MALARVLALEPSVLLMDERFSSLGEGLKAEIREILGKAGTTYLLVSHDQWNIEAICDRAVNIGE